MIILFFSCTPSIDYTRLFDAPSHVQITQTEQLSLFSQPVGFVSNARSGMITPIDIMHLGPLSDQKASPFLRSRGIATGSERQLEKSYVYEDEVGHVRLLIHDPFHKQLVDIPYLQEDHEPISPQHTEIIFQDLDASGDNTILEDLTLSIGFTTTEDWICTFDGSNWIIVGSRSGPQPYASFSESYVTQNHEFSGVFSGTATKGDTITFSTDTGITEIDLGARPLDFTVYNDMIYVTVWDSELSEGAIQVFSLSDKQQIAYYPAPVGAQPKQMLFVDDDTAYVTDYKQSTIYKFSFDDNWVSIPTEGSIHDIFILQTEEKNKLYVGLESAIARYDLDTEEWDDLNLLDPNSNNILLFNTFEQFSQNTLLTTLPSQKNGQEAIDHIVMVSMASGEILLLEGETGCLATTTEGPTLEDSGDVGSGTVIFYDEGNESSPSLSMDTYTGDQVILNTCGGILKDETWTITFDEALGDWQVKGSFSGIQQNRAQAHRRYLSDKGEISFTLTDGTLPPTDGDYFKFDTLPNLLLFSSVTNTQDNQEPLKHPRSAVFYEQEEAVYAAVPIEGNDILIRIDISDWLISGIWN